VAGDQQKFQVAMAHADRFSQEGKWADAMKAYRFALAEFPNNEAAITGFGKSGLAIGQVEIAWKAFQQILRVNPANLEALNYMADIQERLGQVDAAAETYFRIGNVYAAQNNLEAALEVWMRTTALASGQVNAHLKIAETLAQQGNIRPAAREYLKLAAIYQQRDDSGRVLEYVQAAQKLLPDDPGVIAALEAVEEDAAIEPELVGDTPPEEDLTADYAGDYYQEEDPFSEDELSVEEDIFADLETEMIKPPPGGLIEGARQQAMSELANLVFEQGDQPGAILIMQALDFQSRDSLREAINSYRQAINMGARPASLHYNLGLLYKEQGLLNDAIETLKIAGQDSKYGIAAQFALGDIYNNANDLSLAVRHYIGALKMMDLQTVSGERSYELSQIYDKLAQSYGAQTDAGKTRQFIKALQNFFGKGDWEEKVYEARQRMNKVAEDGDTMSLAEFLETPETEVVVTTLAVTGELMKGNMLLTASEECLRAIQKAPTFLPLHSRLADILIKQDRIDQAITKYLYIANVYQMRRQPDQSVNVYQKVLKLAPMDVTVRAKLIDLYISQEMLDPALEQYLVLADSYYQLAQVDRALEKYNEALRMAANSSQADHWKGETLNRIADIYNQRFDWANATKAYEELIKANPRDERVLRQLVELYFKQNKLNEAATTLDRLLAIYQRQSPLKALDLLKELSSYYPDNMFLRQRLAVAYAQNNMNREAIAEYDALGEMQMEHGLRDQAVQTIQAIINLGPDDVEGYRRLLDQISGGSY
jgi:tetratricopeptide (TPR) repeat protein